MEAPLHGRLGVLVRYAALGIALIVAVAGLVAAILFVPFLARVERHGAQPDRGFHAPYFLYVPPGARARGTDGGRMTLLVQPNNSGINSDDAQVHEDDAWWTAFGRARLADELGVALLVPAFVRPAADWQIYTHALDRDSLTTNRPDLARPDLQLIAMVDDARAALAAEGCAVDERFLLQGFSASGMFANRFAALHPNRVKAVAAGSPGGWPIAPVSSWNGQTLAYPAGVADIADFTGKPFDAAAFCAIPQLVVMGDLDDNDSVDFRDGWDEFEATQVDELFGVTPLARWDAAKAIYRAARANAMFLLVPGVGHDRRALQEHSTRFFLDVLAAERPVAHNVEP
ncbi:MAG: hypothetical protein JNK53_09030 [Phycisphaerae bacterium]|nr:hypothetical protein [Phycisphaerae bacterium]